MKVARVVIEILFKWGDCLWLFIPIAICLALILPSEESFLSRYFTWLRPFALLALIIGVILVIRKHRCKG